jgi:hypothetical protein
MSDPCAELQTALIAALKADDGVIAAFAGSPVRVFDTPPTNAKGDYIIVGFLQPLPIDGSDAANTEVTLDIWSLTDPPGKTKAMRLGAAATACALGLTDLPSHIVTSTLPTSAQYQIDSHDAVTAHGIVRAEIVTQPKS